MEEAAGLLVRFRTTHHLEAVGLRFAAGIGLAVCQIRFRKVLLEAVGVGLEVPQVPGQVLSAALVSASQDALRVVVVVVVVPVGDHRRVVAEAAAGDPQWVVVMVAAAA